LGLLLVRYLTMLLSSLAGTLLMAYSGLCLAEQLSHFDAVSWSQQRLVLLDWACVGVTLLGFVLQILLERRRHKKPAQTDEDMDEEGERLRRPPPKRTWWGSLTAPKKSRRAA